MGYSDDNYVTELPLSSSLHADAPVLVQRYTWASSRALTGFLLTLYNTRRRFPSAVHIRIDVSASPLSPLFFFVPSSLADVRRSAPRPDLAARYINHRRTRFILAARVVGDKIIHDVMWVA